MSSLETEIARRRTFAIISHPDAGKTTLTEKLLLYGGAIQLAGSVKSRKADRHATSDWMALEQQRGISVTSSVMQFEHRDCIVNLLDTPGHEDAIMVELVCENLEEEISAYTEFCEFRTAEEKRRKNQGIDTEVGREDWLADKRAVLHSRMRKRRANRASSAVRTIRLF